MSARDVIARQLWAEQKDVGAVLSALSAAGYVVEQGWCCDMSKAPRDGTQVLLIARYPDGATWSDQYHSWWSDGRWARWPHSFPPSAWRPLPAPPVMGATDDGR